MTLTCDLSLAAVIRDAKAPPRKRGAAEERSGRISAGHSCFLPINDFGRNPLQKLKKFLGG